MDWVTERLKLKDIYPTRAAELAQETGMDVDELELIRKGRVSERVEVQKGERAVVNYITTGAIDRDGEIVEPTGAKLKNYRQNPVVMWAHRYDQLPVAKNLWVKSDDKGLRAKTRFLEHDFADQVYRLYSESIYDGKKDTGPALKAFSIGFVPLKWDDDGAQAKDKKTKPKRTYTEWELLEYSCVPVPSNPEALTIAVGKGLKIGDELKKDLGIEIVAEKVESQEVVEIKDGFELVLKPEETDDYIRIPVRDCKVTATIDISKKEGIKALYCGKEKKVKTYLFAKAKGWDMKKAKEWIKEHDGKSLDDGVEIEEKQTYKCECIKCGWTTTTEKHCKDIKCEKCGGTMRRAERPGPGQESADSQITVEVNADTTKLEETLDRLKEKYSDILELKEGRVLSAKNRKLVKQCADMLLALYEATEKVEPDKGGSIVTVPKLTTIADGEDVVVELVDEKIEVNEDLIEQKVQERLAANGGRKLTHKVLGDLADEIAGLTGRIRES